jgi:GDP-4-dehydro-6-deoxy-D-mannose reductase
MAKVPVEARPDPSRMRPSDVPVLQADTTKFRAATGWAPEIPFEQTLEDTLEYWRERIR